MSVGKGEGDGSLVAVATGGAVWVAVATAAGNTSVAGSVAMIGVGMTGRADESRIAPEPAMAIASKAVTPSTVPRMSARLNRPREREREAEMAIGRFAVLAFGLYGAAGLDAEVGRGRG